MYIDFGKPFNGVLARLNIAGLMLVWIFLSGGIIRLGFVHGLPLIMWVLAILIIMLAAIILFYQIRNMWLYPKFRITSEKFLARDVGPVWRLTKYNLKAISNVRGYVLPYVSFKHGGKKIILYLPLMRKKERTRLVSELGLAANKALKCAPTAPDAAKLRRLT